MSIPYPDDFQIDYHADRHAERIRRALQRLDPGDVLAVIDGRIAAEPEMKVHPLYHLVCWHLERQLTPLDGGAFFDRFNQLVKEAIASCLDEALAQGED